jgi:ribonuclease T2
MLTHMQQRTIALFLVFVVAAGCRSHAPASTREAAEPATTQANASGFDYYLLNLSWSPEFCYSHRSVPECAAHDTFVMHGLWPENNDGTYPENCPDALGPANPGQYSDLYPDAGLLEHEWRTHGTCTGLSADAFFAAARTAFQSVKIPPVLKNLTAETSMTPEEILSLFTDSNPGIPRSSLVLSCGHNYLTAVEVCLDKGLHPAPCKGVRSCRANTVRIPAP